MNIRQINEELDRILNEKQEIVLKEVKDETIYVLRHPDYPDVSDIACKSRTLIKYAEERRQDFIKTDDNITSNIITDIFQAKTFLIDNGYTITDYVLY